MRCPFCTHAKDKVVDSRESGSGDSIRRRRECLECGRRFTSYERIEEIPYLVIKKDGRREAFDRAKLMAGLHRACEKRPVSAKQLTTLVDDVEQMVQNSVERVFKLLDLPRRSDIDALNENLQRVARALERLEAQEEPAAEDSPEAEAETGER